MELVCGEDEWACIELPDGDKLLGRWVCGMRLAARALGEVAEHRVRQGKGRTHDISPSCVERALRGARRRLHDRRPRELLEGRMSSR